MYLTIRSKVANATDNTTKEVGGATIRSKVGGVEDVTNTTDNTIKGRWS